MDPTSEEALSGISPRRREFLQQLTAGSHLRSDRWRPRERVHQEIVIGPDGTRVRIWMHVGLQVRTIHLSSDLISMVIGGILYAILFGIAVLRARRPRVDDWTVMVEGESATIAVPTESEDAAREVVRQLTDVVLLVGWAGTWEIAEAA